jgi:5-methylcytosine-specific restriction protein A
MLSYHLDLIQRSLSFATGADIKFAQKKRKGRDFIEIWFGEIDKVNGPIIELSPTGTRRHNIKLRFGSFSNKIIEQMKEADTESVQLARLLIDQLDNQFGVSFSSGMTLGNWSIEDRKFSLEVERKGIDDYLSEREIKDTCKNIITPVLGALAELIGYEEVSADALVSGSNEEEGAKYLSTIVRRERNPRNRLLCLQVHGDKCNVCGFTSAEQYSSLGSVIEVHHIEQLAELEKPKIYDPTEDLIPLCPNCHRAIHKKRPPYTPDELRGLLNGT